MRLLMMGVLTGLLLTAGLAQDRTLEATIEVARFEAGDKVYAEIFLYILGSTVSSDSARRASVNCTYFIYREDQLIAGDKYDLVSPDPGEAQDFMDVKRQYFAPGQYRMVMELMDNADTSNTLTLEKTFEIGQSAGVAVSDIQLLSGIKPASDQDIWTKNGVQCIPLPFNYYHKGYDDLSLYMEVYGTEAAVLGDFYVRFSISPAGEPDKYLLQTAKRLRQAAAIPVVHQIDLRRLSSGEYILSAEVFTHDNTRITGTSVGFTRSNPSADRQLADMGKGLFASSFTAAMSPDSVVYALKALAPVVPQTDVEVLNYLLKKGELENQQRFIHNFWVRQNAQDPEAAYVEYMQAVRAIDQLYHSGLGHGFETDRGYIFLKYGAPDDKIAVEDEPSAPPYEIWFYNHVPRTNQSGVKFLFYDPALSNHFKLLHSTAEGEIYNARWENILYGDALTETKGGDLIDAVPVSSNFHRRAREYFETF